MTATNMCSNFGGKWSRTPLQLHSTKQLSNYALVHQLHAPTLTVATC